MKPKLKAFLHKVNLRHLNKDLNQHIQKDTYDKPMSVKVEHTYFAPTHQVGYGRNGVSTLLDFSTKIIDAKGIYLHRITDSNSNYFRVLVNSNTQSSHGFGRNRPIFIILKKGNKQHTFTVMNEGEIADINIDRMKHLFGYELPNMSREETVTHYRRVVRDGVNGYGKPKFEELCQSQGYEILEMIEYTHQFDIFLEYVKQTKNSIELGYKTFSTYNSLPQTLTISKVKAIKTVYLSDLGTEQAGYYSHDDRMKILPEQVKEVKAFTKRFRKLAK